jgi:hypothetical protein
MYVLSVSFALLLVSPELCAQFVSQPSTITVPNGEICIACFGK